MITRTTAAIFRAEAQALAASLREGALWRLLAVFAALLALAAQAPLRYTIDVGEEVGPGSDLPMLRGVFPYESDPRGAFRWTTERAVIRLPGVGQRPMRLTLTAFGVNAEVAAGGAQELELWAGERLAARLPVRPTGATYHLLLPAPANWSGDQQIELRSATIVPSGDERAVGTPLTAITAAFAAGPALPSWQSLAIWLGCAALAWITLRQAGFSVPATQTLLAAPIVLAALGALFDPPRFAFGALPALTALAAGWLLIMLLRAAPAALWFAGLIFAGVAAACWSIGWRGPDIELGRAALNLRAALSLAAAALLVAGALRPALSSVAPRLGIVITPRAWRWLALIVLMVFVARYGGKIYPDSMHGDIGFHANRFADVARGRVLLVSRNRGVDFPYPPALYLALAPFTLLDIDRRAILQLGAATLDALSPILVYALAAAAFRRADRRIPLVAAAFYGLAPAGFLTTWWNFSTHIFSQFTHLLLITTIVLLWPALYERATRATPRLLIIAILVVIQLLVYLGHFGFWMNVSLLGGIGLAALGVAAVRQRQYRPALIAYGGAFAIAQALTVLLFYSGYTGLFAAQLAATSAGGLTGLAGRERASFDILWVTLWDAGFRQHFGSASLALAPAGIALLAARRGSACTYRIPMLALLGGTLLIALGFAALPFLTGSTLSTRWLMFSAWIVAVCGAAGGLRLWHSGRAGRLLAAGIGLYIAWLTLTMWLAALLWRVRPPEPF